MKNRPAPASNRAPSNATAVSCAVLAIALCLALVYAESAAAAAAYRLIVDGGFLLAWAVSGAGIGAALLMPFARRGNTATNRFTLLDVVTATSLGLGIESLAVLGLGLAGLLNRPTSIAIVVIGIACAVIVYARVGNRRKAGTADAIADAETDLVEEDRSRSAPGRDGNVLDYARAPLSMRATTPSRHWNWAWLLVSPFLAIAIAGSLFTPGLLWKPDEPHGYDAVEYHLQVPREWHEAGRIVPLEHNAFSYFPFNVEMHYLLAMHLRGGPYEGMYLAQLMHVAFVALALAAACGFALKIATSKTTALLAGLLACSVPWLAQLAPIAFNEGGFLLYGTLAIGWALLALREASINVRSFALAGVFAGLACGCKLTAVPEILLGVPAVAAFILLVRRRLTQASADSLRRELAALAGFAIAGLLTFSPWLVRNVAWTGNPVFPEAPGLFGKAHFSDVQVERWKRAHAPQPADRSAVARVRAFGKQVVLGWQFGYVLLPAGIASLFLSRASPSAWFLGGLLVVLLIVWLGFTHLQARFFILAVPLCAMLIALAPWDRLLPKFAMPAAVALAAVVAFIGFLPLHARLTTKLYGGGDTPAGLIATFGGPWEGAENVRWMTESSFEGLPPDATLVLVGDAQAFWYPLPMNRLKYRTIFDADTSGDRGIEAAWSKGVGGETPRWLLIDPRELERYGRTYQPFPALPEKWTTRLEWSEGRPFLIKDAGAAGW